MSNFGITIIATIINIAISGAVVMIIWNKMIADKLGFTRKLSYYDAIAIFVLARILFSGTSSVYYS
jgi:hypothetical protein